MPVTLRQLGYFVALAEEQSFARAAERVHVTQPALSMQIRDLEEALGLVLIERLPRESRLTPAGRDVLARARRILAETAELESFGRHSAAMARLQIGVIPTVAPYLLPPVLAELRAGVHAPDLRIREARTDSLLDDLVSGRLDAIVIASPAGRDDLLTEPLFEDRFLLAASAGRLARLDGAEALRPVTLDPDQLLLLDEGHCLADQALEVCGTSRRPGRIDLGAASLTTLVALVGQGYGLTLLPEIAIRQESAGAPGMALRRFAAPEPARQISLLRRRATPDTGWFTALATSLRHAGRGLIHGARQMMPPG